MESVIQPTTFAASRGSPAGAQTVTRDAEERGQAVDPSVFQVRIAKPIEREPRYLTWDEAEEVASWMPEYVRRIVPIGILTLLRRGEILGLRDAGLDLEAHVFGATADRAVGQARDDGQLGLDLGPG